MHINIHAAHIHGTLVIPPSKSHTLRALIAASLAQGTSSIASPLLSADTASALQVLRALGVRITEDGTDPMRLTIEPPRNRYFFQTGSTVPAELNLGNSGSLLYFLGVLLAVSSSPFYLTGDCSLQGRPVHPLIHIYRQGGIAYQASQTASGSWSSPPLSLQGPLQAQDFHIEGPFSQAVTGLLFALPLLNGTSRIFFENARELPYIRMTCEWLKTSGIRFHAACGYTSFEITGVQRYQPFNTRIPGDWSSAAFPLAAALVCKSTLMLQNLDPSDTQGDSRILGIVQQMGAEISYSPETQTVTITPCKTLHGGSFNCSDIPDAVPVLAAIACFAEGNTVLHHAGVCRFKECDRLHVIAQETSAFGIDITEGKDWLCIKGCGGSNLHPAQVQSHNDHRIAMMLAVIACGIAAAKQTAAHTCIQDFECVEVSYPSFIEDFKSIGMQFSIN